MSDDRTYVLESVDEAVAAGARQSACCELLGVTARTLQRWRANPEGDQRRGPKTAPKNKLSPKERARILELINSEAYRDLSPKQIVPLLADKGDYVASERTIYRILHEEGLQTHREASLPATKTRPAALTATGPNQVYTWDITYLKSPVRGMFFYLYMVIDIWRRKVVGWTVEAHESMELSAQLICEIFESENLEAGQVSLHSDNGGPMKGATMLATLQSLGIVASFSRPSVSNDNPFSESMFRTVKYRPNYPSRPFESLAAAQAWVEEFVEWYNNEHLHSGINYVTPASRHNGEDTAILANRVKVYERARETTPERWSGECRNWSQPGAVVLNGPSKQTLEVAA